MELEFRLNTASFGVGPTSSTSLQGGSRPAAAVSERRSSSGRRVVANYRTACQDLRTVCMWPPFCIVSLMSLCDRCILVDDVTNSSREAEKAVWMHGNIASIDSIGFLL